MNGLVMLDGDDNMLRPAILWNDTRTGSETDYLNNTKRLSGRSIGHFLCLFLISLDSFHRVKLNYLSTLFVPY